MYLGASCIVSCIEKTLVLLSHRKVSASMHGQLTSVVNNVSLVLSTGQTLTLLRVLINFRVIFSGRAIFYLISKGSFNTFVVYNQRKSDKAKKSFL